MAKANDNGLGALWNTFHKSDDLAMRDNLIPMMNMRRDQALTNYIDWANNRDLQQRVDAFVSTLPEHKMRAAQAGMTQEQYFDDQAAQILSQPEFARMDPRARAQVLTLFGKMATGASQAKVKTGDLQGSWDITSRLGLNQDTSPLMLAAQAGDYKKFAELAGFGDRVDEKGNLINSQGQLVPPEVWMPNAARSFNMAGAAAIQQADPLVLAQRDALAQSWQKLLGAGAQSAQPTGAEMLAPLVQGAADGVASGMRQPQTATAPSVSMAAPVQAVPQEAMTPQNGYLSDEEVAARKAVGYTDAQAVDPSIPSSSRVDEAMKAKREQRFANGEKPTIDDLKNEGIRAGVVQRVDSSIAKLTEQLKVAGPEQRTYLEALIRRMQLVKQYAKQPPLITNLIKLKELLDAPLPKQSAASPAPALGTGAEAVRQAMQGAFNGQ